MNPPANIKILFIAGFGPIVTDSAASRKLYQQTLGIDFHEEDGGYLHTGDLNGANHFALWPLEHAADMRGSNPSKPRQASSNPAASACW